MSSERLYWYSEFPAEEGAGSGRDHRQDALEMASGWERGLLHIIENARSDEVLRHDTFERPIPPRWVSGRVALLGDAAHAMFANMGQGGCQALEDAVVLASKLRDGRDPQVGLRTYEVARRRRVRTIAARSYRMFRVEHLSGWMAGVRNAAVGLVPRPILNGLARTTMDFQAPELVS
jgi:2-polyprenyl-6-methoxyphenol hydroxylase-like FAD-dependent oxidoreductase